MRTSIKKSKLKIKSRNDKKPNNKNQNKNCLQRSKLFLMSNNLKINLSIESPEKLMLKQK